MMNAPAALLDYLQNHPEMGLGQRSLIILMTQLGDFDSTEYAQALVPALPAIESAKINLLAIAIGDEEGADRFCDYTKFPRNRLEVLPNADLHLSCGLYEGFKTGANPWVDLMMMCAGYGSPGTLREVARGYIGDRNAPQRLDNPFFEVAGGKGFQRPFELATVRLNNMIEVIGRWRQYVPNDTYICQRGGTFLLESDNSILYSHKDRGILGFSETMNQPLQFLTPYINL